jgi:hypothetical protein
LISSLIYQDLPTLLTLRANGYRLLVITPDPIALEQNLLGKNKVVTQAARIARLERNFMLQQIQQTGARVLEWQVDQPFFNLASTSLTKSTYWDRNQVVEYA